MLIDALPSVIKEQPEKAPLNNMNELLKKLSVIPIVTRGKIFETALLNLHTAVESKSVVTSEDIEEFLRIAAEPYL